MEILNQFGINPLLLTAQAVNFLVLLFILKKFLYGPILKVLDNRKKTIEESLKNAQEIERKLQRAGDQAEKIIDDAQKESKRILDQTNSAAAQILEEANRSAERIILRAEEEAGKIVLREKEVLMQQVRANIANLVALVLEKVIGKTLVNKDKKEMVKREIENLS